MDVTTVSMKLLLLIGGVGNRPVSEIVSFLGFKIQTYLLYLSVSISPNHFVLWVYVVRVDGGPVMQRGISSQI